MSIFTADITQRAAQLLGGLRAKHYTLATAESCTGGLIGALITSIAGASDVYTHGFITYANAAKEGMIGVPHALLETHGAVSEPVARAMAEGAQRVAGSSVAVSVTGIAGPGGGSPEKPVGMVHLACVGPHGTQHAQHLFSGDRDAVRLHAVQAALALIEAQLA